MRNRKKREVRSNGINFPNVHTDRGNSDKPCYTSNKSTQTDMNNTPVKPCYSHSTPKILRRRSLSVGNSPMSNIDGSAERNKSAKNLFESTPTATSAKNLFESTQTAPSAKNVIESTPTATSAKKLIESTVNKSKSGEAPKQKPRFSKALIEVCQEFARQEEEANAEHLANKAAGRFHLCPKMNFESSSSTVNDMQLTDTSCTSTCACRNEQQATNMDTSDSNTFKTTGSEESPFLHLTLDEDEDEDEAEKGDTDTSTLGRTSTSGKADTSTPVAKDSEKEKPKDSSPADREAATKRKMSMDSDINRSIIERVKETGKYPKEFQPDYYTQIRDRRFPDSPSFKLFKHIRDVNESKAELDVSLLPMGTAITYSPPSKRITLDLSADRDADAIKDANESAPPEEESATGINPQNFYHTPEN